MGINCNETLKAGNLLEIDKLPENMSEDPVAKHYSSWIKEAGQLNAGSIGGKGYDLACGRYLKLDLQTEIDEAAIKSLQEKQTTYWDLCPELPEQIAMKLSEENGLTVNAANEICITSGITPAIDTTLSAFINPGDEVISMDPDFVTSYGQIIAKKAKLVIAPSFIEHKGVLDENRWEFRPEGLESSITPATKMLVFSNPNNPIGYVYSKSDLDAIADIAIRHNLVILENECYERQVHSQEFFNTLKFNSFAAIPKVRDRVITIQGVSKGFHLSGYRIGWVVASKSIIQMLMFVQIWSTFPFAPTASQYGVCKALQSPIRQDYARTSLKVYKENIDYTCEALKAIPQVECSRPMAGPFCFMDVTNTGYTDIELAHRLYKEGVSTTFGSSWGKLNGKNHIRLALSNEPAYQKECVNALVAALKRIV